MALARPTTPEPGAWPTRVVLGFPSRVEGIAAGRGVIGWIADWHPEHPEITLDWIHWMHDHSRRPAAAYRLEARLRLARGERSEARKHLERALAFERDRDLRAALERQIEALGPE